MLAAPCGACGVRLPLARRAGLWPELIAAWDLTPEWARWFGEREGHGCRWCGANLRSQQLAKTIVRVVNDRHGTSAPHLRALFRDPRARRLSIAEINAAGQLHKYLRRCDGLRYSEYGSRTPRVPSEDLTQLSYEDASFDLVTTSEVLEHVPDVDAGLREIHRILRPEGAHVFTIPMVGGRPTRQRAKLEEGQVVHLLPPSYHGRPGDTRKDLLVFHEFGDDFVDRVEDAGFEVERVTDPDNRALVTLVARRPR